MSLFNRLDWQRIGVVVETDYRRHVFSVGFVGLVVMHVAVFFFIIAAQHNFIDVPVLASSMPGDGVMKADGVRFLSLAVLSIGFSLGTLIFQEEISDKAMELVLRSIGFASFFTGRLIARTLIFLTGAGLVAFGLVGILVFAHSTMGFSFESSASDATGSSSSPTDAATLIVLGSQWALAFLLAATFGAYLYVKTSGVKQEVLQSIGFLLFLVSLVPVPLSQPALTVLSFLPFVGADAYISGHNDVGYYALVVGVFIGVVIMALAYRIILIKGVEDGPSIGPINVSKLAYPRCAHLLSRVRYRIRLLRDFKR
ncbi:conserved membrane hypothetical protein [Oceanicaulis sp. 350]|nr:conserved membrane hypothetical protein [Oceanicaulis sp. 350]